MKTEVIVICVVAITKGKLLLVLKKGVWILPGGKLEGDESDHECLVREIFEELPGVELVIGDFFDEFQGEAPHLKEEFETRVYYAGVSGDILPAAEISGSCWTKTPEDLNLSEVTGKIVAALRQNGLL